MSEDFDTEVDELLADLGGAEEKDTAPKPVGKKRAAKKRAAKQAKTVTADKAGDEGAVEIPEGWSNAEFEARQKKEHKFAPGEMKLVTIQKEKGKGGDRPVPVCWNGKQFTVPRGVRVPVPAPVAEILANAEETLVEWDGNKTFEFRDAASYPVAVM